MMAFEARTVGAGKRRHIRYFIGEMYFDTLEAAALVTRYLNGANMPEADQEQAKEYMRQFDQRPKKA